MTAGLEDARNAALAKEVAAAEASTPLDQRSSGLGQAERQMLRFAQHHGHCGLQNDADLRTAKRLESLGLGRVCYGRYASGGYFEPKVRDAR